MTRRHVLTTLTSSAVTLCPAVLRAQSVPAVAWDGLPTTAPVGEDQLITLPAGPAEVDISTLQPGEVAVIARPGTGDAFANTGQTDYIAVLRRTEAQIAFAANSARAVAAQDPRYLVVSLICPHRGKAVGMTGDADVPFACLDQGRRHASFFDASGAGVSGASEDKAMTVPAHTLSGADGAPVILSLT